MTSLTLTSYFIDRNLPQVIGVTYDAVQDRFFWLDDGSPVRPLDQYNVTSVVYPSDIAEMSNIDFDQDSRFMVYALPDNWKGVNPKQFYDFLNSKKDI